MRQLNHTPIVIELDSVCYSYTNIEVIKDISMRIHKGDYVGIIGPNGGGKTTLIKLMLGLIKPNDGKIQLFGKEFPKFHQWSKIGYVPQKTYIDMSFPITVSEVVIMGRYGKRGLFHSPDQEDKDKTYQALRFVDMIEFKDRQLGDLSGGQQQRVFIARALASEPEIIFLDEPMVGVDIKTQKQFYGLLRKLNNELSITLVLASHELDVVAHEATALSYVNRNLVYYGDPEEFLKGKYFHELIGKEGIHH